MKYEHEIIRDLMPLCADDIASPQSEAAVKEHIAECEECAEEWAQIQKGIEGDKEESKETEGYVKTAKRVRKKQRRVLLTVVLCTLVLVFSGLLIMNYADGARFTMRGAAKAGVKSFLSGSISKPQVTVLDEIKSSDSICGRVFSFVKRGENCFLFTVDMNRANLFWMWDSTGGSSTMVFPETIIVEAYELHSVDGGYMTYADIYVGDDRVKNVQFVMHDNIVTAEINENHFANILLPFIVDTSERITEGTALDKDGNVLYQIEPVTRNIDGTEYTSYEWVKVE